jgi:hypothetical protein
MVAVLLIVEPAAALACTWICTPNSAMLDQLVMPSEFSVQVTVLLAYEQCVPFVV